MLGKTVELLSANVGQKVYTDESSRTEMKAKFSNNIINNMIYVIIHTNITTDGVGLLQSKHQQYRKQGWMGNILLVPFLSNTN